MQKMRKQLFGAVTCLALAFAIVMIGQCHQANACEEQIQKINCVAKPLVVKTFNQGSVTLPVVGKFVEESHYLVESDYLALGKRYPKNGSEAISAHLKRSCAILERMELHKGSDCSDVYKNSWQKVWTPSENGKIGQGSRGVVFNSDVGEMFQGNMMAPNFKKDTKFLAEYGGKKVVIVMGYEVGPSSKSFIGGVTPEVHWYLGTNNSSKIKLSYLTDQSVKPGPAQCR